MIFQKTISEEISAIGIGLHTGKKVHFTLLPEDPDRGITIHRTDINIEIPVHLSYTITPSTSITLGIHEKGTVSTVEHLLSSLYCLGIDNLRIMVDGGEIPIMDGSSAPFVFLIKNAGLKKQSSFRKYICIKRPIKVRDGNRSIYAEPSDSLKITYKINFDHPLIRDQEYRFFFSEEEYVSNIARARTFGFLRDTQPFRDTGLAKGGSLDNAIVLDDFRVLNEDGLRYKNEFVRHKLLDFIGDLKLLGYPIIGNFIVERAGHRLSRIFLVKLLSDKRNYDVVGLHHLEDFPIASRNAFNPNLFISEKIQEDPFIFSTRKEFSYGTVENISSPEDMNILHPLIEEMIPTIYLISEKAQFLEKNRLITFSLDEEGKIIVNLLGQRGYFATQNKSRNMNIVNIGKQEGQFVISNLGTIKSEMNYYQAANKLIDDSIKDIINNPELDIKKKEIHISKLRSFRDKINDDSVTLEETKKIFSEINNEVPSIFNRIKEFIYTVSTSTVSSILVEGLKKLVI